MGDGYLDPDLHLAAAAAEERSFWARGRNELVVWALRRHFPDARSLLDVGCGTGIVLRALRDAAPGLDLVGVEPFEPALAEARRRLPGLELSAADARALPFTARFDVVTALDVLEHVDDDGAALRSIRRALRPGGGLLAAVPQHPWLWSAADEWALHHRRYRRGDLVRALDRAGFELLRATSFVSLPLPGMLVSRVLARGRPYDPLAELTLPRPLDRALGALLRLERAAIAAGLDLPAGGSLLVVARSRA